MTLSKELKFEIRNKPENQKSETRNPKQIQITKIPMIKTAFNIIFRRWFFIVLDIVLRVLISLFFQLVSGLPDGMLGSRLRLLFRNGLECRGDLAAEFLKGSVHSGNRTFESGPVGGFCEVRSSP